MSFPPNEYSLPTASDTILGGIKVGSRLTIADGVLSADEQEGGSYTLPTASADTLGGVKIGSGITITDGVISVTGGVANIIGIEWDTGSTNPTLRWIDVDGNTAVPTETYWNTHPIFSQIVRVRLDAARNEVEVGNGRGDGITLTSNYIMTRFPRIYVKYGKYTTNNSSATQDDTSGRYYRTWISPAPYCGFHLDHAYYQEGFVSPANYLYIGSFTANDESTIIGSKSDVASLVSTTMATFYSKAQTIGTGWGIIDVYDWGLIQRLFYIRFGHLNSQYILAPGRTNDSNTTALNSGSATSLLNEHGHGGGNDTQAMAVFGLENWWGNLWQYVIGLNVTGGNIRIVKPDGTGALAEQLAAGSYLETSGFTPVVADGTYPSAYLFADPVKGLFLPSNNSGGSSATYLCDGHWGANAGGTTYILAAGGAWYDAALVGAGYLDAYDEIGYVYSDIGARLRALR